MMPRSGLACVGVSCTGELGFVRADGNCECRDCGKLYYDHPHCSNSEIPQSMMASSFPEYVLRVLCSGLHVKL